MTAYSRPDDWLQVDPALDFTRPELGTLVALWCERCRDGRLPARADFDLVDLKGHLGWIVLSDVDRAGPTPLRFRYRLIGTQVAISAGRDMTGRYLDEIYTPEIHRIVTAGYRAAIELRRPIRVHGYFRQVDRSFMAIESVELPLASDGETIDMLMIRDCISFAGDQRPRLDQAAE